MGCVDLDGAGRKGGVHGALGPGNNLARGRDDGLGLQVGRARAQLGAGLGVELDLGDALPVAQVDEDDPAMVADRVDPSREGHGGADVGLGQLGTVMGAFHSQFEACKWERKPPGAGGGNPILGPGPPGSAAGRGSPVISAGFGRPIRCRTVGAMSASLPPSRILVFPAAYPSPTTKNSTRFRVWEVWGTLFV